jgi:hypothetical protein
VKNQSKIALELVTVAALCLASRASAIPHTNIVVNGGFEEGNFNHWTQSGNTSNTGVNGSSANSGSFGAFAGPVGSLGYLSQTLNTVAGGAYDLTFFMNATGPTSRAPIGLGSPFDFQVFWNGALIFETFTAPSSFTKFSFGDLLATGSTTDLQFGFRNDAGFFHLDDVMVFQTPETFSTLWLALPMAGIIGFFQLRRKRALRAT